MKTDLTIIIPAKNEAHRIGESLDKLSGYIKQHDLGEVEVILVINNAQDGTVAIARQKTKLFNDCKVIVDKSHGKGSAVKRGMLSAHGGYRLFMDADLATPLHHLQSIKKYMDEGVDVIIGVRNLSSSHTGLRKFISGFGNLLVRIVLGLKIQDTQCGFKAFKDTVATDIFNLQRIWGWGFDMEALAIARKRKYSLQTLQIDDWRDVAGGTFNNVAVTGALSTLKDLLKIKLNLLSGKYKAQR